MRRRIWGIGLILGLALGLFTAGTALAAGPLLNLGSGDSGTVNLNLTGSVNATNAATATATVTAAATTTDKSDVVTDVVNTVTNTANGLVGGAAATPAPTQAATPVTTPSTTNASVTAAATVTTTAATPVATSTPEATATPEAMVTTQATATASDSTTSSAAEPTTTVQDNLGPTVDQTVANANGSVQQVTDNGQQVLGVNGVTEATTDANVATHLSDPENGPLVDSNICLNATLLTDNDPAAANCSTTPADTTTGLASVGLQTGGQSTNVLGTGTDLTNNVCLDAQVLTDASSNCDDSTNNGLANVGLSNDTGLGTPDTFGNLGGLAANSCLDASVGGSGSNGCTDSSSNGLLDLGSSAGIDSTGDVAGLTGVSGNVCLGAALLASTDATCQTAINGDNGGNIGGNNGGNNGGNTGDTGGNNGGNTGSNNGGQNANTGENGGQGGSGNGGNVGESGGQAGSGNGGNTAVTGGQAGSGSGGLIPVSYVPSNGGSAGAGTGGVNAPSATTNLPSLMPTTGQATAVAASSSLDTLLLTLVGLLFLLAGSVVTRQARFHQIEMSNEEVR